MFKNTLDELDFFFKPNKIKLIPDIAFSKQRVEFLNQLSINLIRDKNIYKHPDLISLSFWLRKKNIIQLINFLNKDEIKVGRGVAFHITPKNVPTNFFYSFAYSFLSGNANLVKTPSKYFEQVKIICYHLKKIFKKKKFKKFYCSNLFFNYESSMKEITEKISLISDIRIIWGGDETIRALKNIKSKDKTKDIIFNNKFSVAIIKSSKFLKLSKIKKNIMATKLFNDIYAFNQAACTSPHLIFWYGDKKTNNKARNLLWKILLSIVSIKHKLDLGSVSKRYFAFADLVVGDQKKKIKSINNINNKIFTIQLKKINDQIYKIFRGMGIIFEFSSNKIIDLKLINSNKFQSLVYFGFEKKELIKLLKNSIIDKFDRIVPIGQSMIMKQYWDGYDLFNELTRHIEI